MQSLLRFKIDTLISLARITEDSESKQRYIDEIESLLIQCETRDTQYAHDIHDTAHLFTEQKAESRK